MNPFPGLKLHVLPGQAKLKDLPIRRPLLMVPSGLFQERWATLWIEGAFRSAAKARPGVKVQ